MQIRSVIIKVADQDKALSFYVSVVGFVKQQDFLIGGVRLPTISAPEGPGHRTGLGTEHFTPGAGSSEGTI
jgi:catechol 2,3-dioxygenase-like lactoylglutathione lyase family enzyme